jgi:hypothetical protein
MWKRNSNFFDKNCNFYSLTKSENKLKMGARLLDIKFFEVELFFKMLIIIWYLKMHLRLFVPNYNTELAIHALGGLTMHLAPLQ